MINHLSLSRSPSLSLPPTLSLSLSLPLSLSLFLIITMKVQLTSSWKTIEVCERRVREVRASLSIRISPLTLPVFLRPERMSKSVVLPQPEGPITASSSPARQTPLTSRRMVRFTPRLHPAMRQATVSNTMPRTTSSSFADEAARSRTAAASSSGRAGRVGVGKERGVGSSKPFDAARSAVPADVTSTATAALLPRALHNH